MISIKFDGKNILLGILTLIILAAAIHFEKRNGSLSSFIITVGFFALLEPALSQGIKSRSSADRPRHWYDFIWLFLGVSMFIFLFVLELGFIPSKKPPLLVWACPILIIYFGIQRIKKTPSNFLSSGITLLAILIAGIIVYFTRVVMAT